MEKPSITYIITPIAEKYIYRYVYTLHKFSEPNSYRLILIDQIKDGISRGLWDKIKDKVHLYMHPCRNLGYAKAMNTGIIQALHQGTPYICPSNDDIEIIDSRWIDGIYETFKMDERIMGVNPMSPRVPGFGYGVDYNPEVLPYKEEYTKADYDYLLTGDFTENEGKFPDTFPRKIGGQIIDGSIFTMPYFKRELFEKIGLMDERFWPGSGEDMDMMARAYQKNFRIVATSKSWVWHWFSSSKDLFASGELEDPYYKWKSYWNNVSEIWPDGFDAWGYKTNEKGEKILLRRVPEIYVEDL